MRNVRKMYNGLMWTVCNAYWIECRRFLQSYFVLSVLLNPTSQSRKTTINIKMCNMLTTMEAYKQQNLENVHEIQGIIWFVRQRSQIIASRPSLLDKRTCKRICSISFGFLVFIGSWGWSAWWVMWGVCTVCIGCRLCYTGSKCLYTAVS